MEEVAYQVRRSDRARRVRVTVDAVRGVEVVLPRRAPEREAAAAIRELRPWIQRRVAELAGAQAAVAARAAGERAMLTVLEPGSDTCRGQIRVDNVDWDQRRAELRIWLAPQVRGRGLGRAALRLAGEWLLGPCGLARVEVLAEPENRAAIEAAQRAGFVREGVLREYHRKRGHGVDMVIMSLIPADL